MNQDKLRSITLNFQSVTANRSRMLDYVFALLEYYFYLLLHRLAWIDRILGIRATLRNIKNVKMSLSMDDTEDSELSIDEDMLDDDKHDLDKSEQEDQLPLAKDEVSSATKANAIYIPGLANNGANSCFLNSTLQVRSSYLLV